MRDSPVINCSLDCLCAVTFSACPRKLIYYMHISQPTSRTPDPLVTENFSVRDYALLKLGTASNFYNCPDLARPKVGNYEIDSSRGSNPSSNSDGTCAQVSWQQMASFGVHQEGLDDLPQQRGTRESLLPCVVQSRACAHNITGAGGGQKFVPGIGPPRTPRPAHAPSLAWSNKMASFSVGQCVVLQFTPDPWSVRITIAWCACTPPWSAKTCRGKFRV